MPREKPGKARARVVHHVSLPGWVRLPWEVAGGSRPGPRSPAARRDPSGFPGIGGNRGTSGFVRSPGSRSVGSRREAPRAVGCRRLPPQFAPALRRAASRRVASRWSVSAALLAAQLRRESGFNARAVSPAGAQGIAQFMPATARSCGLHDPLTPTAAHRCPGALHARRAARLRGRAAGARGLQRRPRAGAPLHVRAAHPRAHAYVADILGLAAGGGAGADAGLPVRLVR